MNVNEYRSVLYEDIALAANANMSNIEEEFLRYVTDILIAGEEFDDFVECYWEGISRRNAYMRIDGYAMDETDGSCCIFISDFHGPYEDDAIRAEDINSLFKKIRYFVEEATKYELYLELEESTQVTENVTQWCKQTKCWERVQKNKWTIHPEFIKTLVSVEMIKSEVKDAKEKQKVNNEVDE